MTSITAAQVKELREKSGAGMMDCKKALTETGGAVEAAVDWLRKNELAAVTKKAGRVASEGLVSIASSGASAAVVEINAETDFVARNDDFQAFAGVVAGLALDNGGDLDALIAAAYPGGGTVAERVTELVAKIGENIQVRRSAALSVDQGVVATYVHGAVTPKLGRIAVLVALESVGDVEKLVVLGKQIAMHVAAARPETVSIDNIDPAVVERERSVLADQARASGKPEEIVEKMVEGRLRKYYEEIVLLEQIFVIDGQTKVGKVLEDAAGDIGGPVRISGFVRFALGEGVEKKETDFAAEVAAQVAR